MANLKYGERDDFEALLGMRTGYVLDFTNRQFREPVTLHGQQPNPEELGYFSARMCLATGSPVSDAGFRGNMNPFQKSCGFVS